MAGRIVSGLLNIERERSVIPHLMRCFDGFARGLGLDGTTTRGIVEEVVADMLGEPDEDRFTEARRRMIVASRRRPALSN